MDVIIGIPIHIGLNRCHFFNILSAFIKDVRDIHGYLISMSNPSFYGYVDTSTHIFILV